MFLSFQRIAVNDVVKTAAALTVPAAARGAMLQADTNSVRYTMDDDTDPTVGSGMLLLTTSAPEHFLIEDVKRIRFVQGPGGAGGLNVHYYGPGSVS